MRFNPPPNWPPAPPGWTPPPGWQPDASWPPVPPGWQLWVSDPPRRKTGLIIAAALAATLLVVVGVVVAIAMTRDTPQVTVTPPTTTNELSDEQQIEDVVSRFQDAWNDEDFSGFEPIVCQEMREAEEFNESDFLQARQESDEMDISVTSVDVDGDSATASVKGSGGSRDIPFLREADGWKWCDP
jgi:hypothetical protein